MSVCTSEVDSSECVEKEMSAAVSEPDAVSVNVAHSADLHGAMTGIISPAQIQAATEARKQSDTAAMYEVGDWAERATAASVQLVGFTRINSQRRAEMIDQVLAGLHRTCS